MNIVKIIAKYLLIVVGLLLVVSLFLPSKVHVERTALVKGSPETVYKLIANLKNWERWSPWHRIDPKMKLEYGAVFEGVGGEYAWKSTHSQVGNGSIKIVDAKQASYVKTDMNFMENGVANAEYFLSPKDGGTEVRWTMDSDMGWNPVGRYFGLFIEKMVGEDYEKGLHYLDSVAQITKPEATFTMNLEMGKMPAAKYLLVKGNAQEAEIGKTLGEIYGRIGAILKEQGMEMAGAPMAFYEEPQGGIFTFEAGIPISTKPGKPLPADVMFREMPEMEAAIAHFAGPYEKTAEAYPALEKLIQENRKTYAGNPMESYVSDPAEAKTPLDIKTDIYWPVK